MSSIKIRMTVATSLLMAGTLSILAFVALVYFENQLKIMVSGQQFTLVSAIADQIDDKLEAARTELTAVAGTVTTDILTDPVKAQKFLAGRPDTLAMFDNGVFIFSAGGKLIAGTPLESQMRGRNYSDREYFKKTMATRKPQISEPFLSVQKGQHPIIALTAPIFDANGEITAILAGGIDLIKNNFLGGLASIKLGDKGYLYIYNTSRMIIVHPDRSRALKRDLPRGVNQLFDKAIEGFEGTGETITAKGMHAISSFKRLKSTGWILSANFPESEAYAPVYRAKRYLLMALTVVLIGSVLVVWLFMKHLTAPLLSFTGQIRELTGKKDSQIRIRVETSDEIGILAEAFNAMLAELDLQKKELQKQLHFSQALIDTIPNPIYYKDAEGEYLGGNKAFTEYTGMPMDQLIGKSVFDFAQSNLAEIYGQADRELFQKRGVQVYETSVVYADGTLHDVIFFKATFPADDGSPGGLIGTLLDITERKHAESELAAQKEFAENLVQNSTAPTFVLDSQHRIIIWNRACEQLTGVKAAEVLGTDEPWKAFYDQKRPVLADFVIDDNLEKIPEFYSSCSKSKVIPGGLQAERWFTNLNGMNNYIIFNAAPIRNTKGELVAVIQTLEDITDRKYKEDQLKKLSQAVEQSPVTVMITDLGGTIEYVNRQFTELTGYMPEEAVGRNPRILRSQNMLPQHYKDLWERITVGLEWRGEFLNTKKNGEHYWEAASISPVKNNSGMITHFMALKTDITEQKKGKDFLKDSEDKLQAISDTATDAILLVDDGGKVVYWNRAAELLFGYTADEIMEIEVGTIVPDRYRQAHSSGFGRFAATGEGLVVGKTHEIFAVRKDGTEFPVELSISGVRLKGRWHAAGIIRDISERKSLENQLRHAQKMEALGTFSGGIAHDFNNILTAITAYCALIERKTTDDSPVRPYLEKLLAATDRASALTRSLLAYSRKQPLNPQPVDLNSIIAKVDHLLSRILGEDIELAILPTYGSLSVLVDSLQVEQVLMNLATNARDAMPQGGVLQIGTGQLELGPDFIKTHGYGQPGSYAIVTVSDSGSGMDEKTRERVFEPFFTTKGVDKGTGLGLSIAYGIIKQHNGYINVYSEPGKGTTFTIYLPLTELPEETSGQENLLHARSGNETILLVEDDTEIRATLKECLEGEGYKIIEAVDGEDGVQKYREHEADVQFLILDVVMPKKDGKAVYDEIRAERPDMKALFISGYTADLLHAKGVLQANVNFISKPIIVNTLLFKIREVLER